MARTTVPMDNPSTLLITGVSKNNEWLFTKQVLHQKFDNLIDNWPGTIRVRGFPVPFTFPRILLKLCPRTRADKGVRGLVRPCLSNSEYNDKLLSPWFHSRWKRIVQAQAENKCVTQAAQGWTKIFIKMQRFLKVLILLFVSRQFRDLLSRS